MKNEDFIYVTSNCFSWHRLLHPPTGGLLIYFLPVEENKLITLHRSVRYSAIHDIHPLPPVGGAADFANKETMKGVGQHSKIKKIK